MPKLDETLESLDIDMLSASTREKELIAERAKQVHDQNLKKIEVPKG